MKLPMRFKIIKLMDDNATLSDVDVLNALKNDYGNDKQCKKTEINNHLISLKSSGLLKERQAVCQDSTMKWVVPVMPTHMP